MSTSYETTPDRPKPSPGDQKIGEAVQDVAEQVQILVREEIELAKAEIQMKAKKLVKGIVVGSVALVFVLAALNLILHGLSWLAWWGVPFGDDQTFFWGFFIVAFILLVLAVVCALLAKKWITGGAPPTPDMAIEEAQRIKATVSGPDDEVKR